MSKDKPKNPVSEEGRSRVLRGGSWRNYDNSMRSSSRYLFTPDNRDSNFGGFRIVKNIPKDPKESENKK